MHLIRGRFCRTVFIRKVSLNTRHVLAKPGKGILNYQGQVLSHFRAALNVVIGI